MSSRIRYFSTIDSTQAEAKRLIQAREIAHDTILLAGEQTGGVGARNTGWVSPGGNLYMTWVLLPEEAGYILPTIWKVIPTHNWAQLTHAAAVAVGDTLYRLCGAEVIRYKWKNDILLQGAKVAGLLVEVLTSATGREAPAICIGIGVNIVSSPSVALYPTTFLSSFISSSLPCVEHIACEIVDRLNENILEWYEKGIGAIARKWFNSACNIASRNAIKEAYGLTCSFS